MASVFHEHIYLPASDAAVLSLYTQMGFPGCVGSTDCEHFYWERCPHYVRHLYLGYEGKPTVAYSLVAEKLLCCSSTSTFATFAISAISGVLNGLRIKRIQLFAKFA